LVRWRYIVLLGAAFAAGGVGVWALSGNDDEAPPAPDPEAASPTATAPEGSAQPGAGGEDKPTPSENEREAVRAVHRYVEAINDRNGRALCQLVPSLTGELDLPEQRGGCAHSVRASIGYADPRGFPQWRRSRLGEIRSAAVDGSSARVVATVVTYFADRKEPSIEDDVLYLEESGGRWGLAKPSATLYRAIGAPDVPPRALQEP
jgi:hypothetical protein